MNYPTVKFSYFHHTGDNGDLTSLMNVTSAGDTVSLKYAFGLIYLQPDALYRIGIEVKFDDIVIFKQLLNPKKFETNILTPDHFIAENLFGTSNNFRTASFEVPGDGAITSTISIHDFEGNLLDEASSNAWIKFTNQLLQ